MNIRLTLLSALLVAYVTSAALIKRNFGPVTIFTPPASYKSDKSLYARSLMLTVNDNKGTLLTTWENYSDVEPPWFPIYRSDDHGYTWAAYSNITDQVNGWGLRYQPFLLELKQSFAGYAAGTILAAGNSIPQDLSKTKIDVYASTDKGKTWKFVSSVAAGGKAVPNNGETPVWEPFLMVVGNQLVCYYSDQRDPKYGQKLVHQTTTDLRSWSAVVNDVAVSPYSSRPGMPIISKMSNGNYIMTYEYGGAPEGQFAVYYKISNDPLSWNDKTGQALKTTSGLVPTSSPYNIFTPAGGAKGTLVVNSYSSNKLFLNHNYGQGAWTELDSVSPASYSRSLAVGFNNKDAVIVGGGPLGQKGKNNRVTFTATSVA